MHDSLCYLTSGIMIRHLPSHKEKMVWHLQYTDWPDHGCPEDTYGFLGQLSFLMFCVLSVYSLTLPVNVQNFFILLRSLVATSLIVCPAKVTYSAVYKRTVAVTHSCGSCGLIVRRLLGMQEVLGSNPLRTKTLCWFLLCSHFLSSKLLSNVCHSS